MTVIVWDGKSVAVDSLATNGGRKRTVEKFRELDNGTVLLWTGDHEEGLVLADWYENGCKPEGLPKYESKEDFTLLIVLHANGWVEQYSCERIPERLHPPFAWGDGAPYALGAMAMGADAAHAAEAACGLSVYCSTPVHVFGRPL